MGKRERGVHEVKIDGLEVVEDGAVVDVGETDSLADFSCSFRRKILKT